MEIIESRDHIEIAKLVKTVHDLHVELYPDYFTPYSYGEMAIEFKKLVGNEKFTFLIVKDEGLSKGFVFFEVKEKPYTPFKKAYRTLYVHQLSVVEGAQGNGYGSALMRKLEETAKDNKVDCIELDYWVRNAHAKLFYEKLGYKLEREYVRKDIK